MKARPSWSLDVPPEKRSESAARFFNYRTSRVERAIPSKWRRARQRRIATARPGETCRWNRKRRRLSASLSLCHIALLASNNLTASRKGVPSLAWPVCAANRPCPTMHSAGPGVVREERCEALSLYRSSWYSYRQSIFLPLSLSLFVRYIMQLSEGARGRGDPRLKANRRRFAYPVLIPSASERDLIAQSEPELASDARRFPARCRMRAA